MSTHEVVLPMFSGMAQKPEKRYRTIVADPPWRYDSKLVGLRGATDYPTMNQHELMKHWPPNKEKGWSVVDNLVPADRKQPRFG